MKNTIILWASAAILTFLAGFIQNRTSGEYPISGTIGIDGKKVSYLLKKVHREKGNYSVILRTDKKNLAGILKWKTLDQSVQWQTDTMSYSDGKLSGMIPSQNAQTEVEYRIYLQHNEKEFLIPSNGYHTVKFLGAVPLSITIHYYLTLFAGLLLAFRGGLEIFNIKPRLRLYSIFSLISFFSCALIFAPVQKTYELGAIGKYIPPFENIFEIWLIVIVIVWIMNLILISKIKSSKPSIIVSLIITLILFFMQNLS
jgi:hypothetical protein